MVRSCIPHFNVPFARVSHGTTPHKTPTSSHKDLNRGILGLSKFDNLS